jgi:hypothetical protein
MIKVSLEFDGGGSVSFTDDEPSTSSKRSGMAGAPTGLDVDAGAAPAFDPELDEDLRPPADVSSPPPAAASNGPVDGNGAQGGVDGGAGPSLDDLELD